MSTVNKAFYQTSALRHIVLINEETGEEIGRLEGLTWKNAATVDGLPVSRCRVSFDKGTKDRDVQGPVKKIGFVTAYKGAMEDAQTQRIKQLEEGLAIVTDQLESTEQQHLQRYSELIAVLRMLGGAVTISDEENADAQMYVIEEAYSPKSGTCLTLVEKA